MSDEQREAQADEVFTFMAFELLSPGLHARLVRGWQSGGLDFGKVSEPV